MLTLHRLFSLLCLSALVIASVQAQDSSELYTKSFAIEGITQLEIHESMRVTISQGPNEQVRAIGPLSMLKAIEAERIGDRLVLASKTRETLPVAFEIQVATLSSLLLDDVREAQIGELVARKLDFLASGAGEFYLQSVRAQDLTITFDGSGAITGDRWIADKLKVQVAGSGSVSAHQVEARSLQSSISGSAEVHLANQGLLDSADVNLSGSGIFNAGDLLIREAAIAIAGSASALVNVEEMLDVNTAGSGIVTYFGTPIIEAGIFGSGLVQQAF